MKDSYIYLSRPDKYPYKVSQFSRKDYMILYNMATKGNNLRYRLRSSKFRDKKFQRTFVTIDECIIFYCPFKDLAKHINMTSSVALDILKWRLSINK